MSDCVSGRRKIDKMALNASKDFDVCVIHSGHYVEHRLENFIKSKCNVLGLMYGQMNFDTVVSMLNENLIIISKTTKIVLIFFSRTPRSMRCRLERLYSLHLHTQSKEKIPVLIPVAIGNCKIPKMYAIFQELRISESADWQRKLLSALIDGNTDVDKDLLSEEFVRSGSECLGTIIDEVSDDADENVDLNVDPELDTQFDKACFKLLDEYLNDSCDEEIISEELKEVLEIQSGLCKKLESSSLRTRMEFMRRNSNSGLFSFIGQMGLNNVHKILMQGCGMRCIQGKLTLQWKTFEQNLIRSTLTLADIVNFAKFAGIEKIAIQFDKESHDKIERQYGQSWSDLLIQFAERILERRFDKESSDMLTYHVCINGKPGNETKHIINNSSRKLFLDKFVQHTTEFDSVVARFDTFKNWPYGRDVPSFELAFAGFIYSGHGDTVTCFSCNQSCFNMFRETHFGDTFRSMIFNHHYWNHDCAFLKSHWHYGLFRQMVSDHKKEEASRQCLCVTSDVFGTTYDDIESRVDSYDKSLPSLRCEEFAKAGFVQRAAENGLLQIQCLFCSAVVDSVKLSQDPWFLHVRWSPDCRFLLHARGPKFIEDALQVLSLEGVYPDDVHAELIIETLLVRKKPDTPSQ